MTSECCCCGCGSGGCGSDNVLRQCLCRYHHSTVHQIQVAEHLGVRLPTSLPPGPQRPDGRRPKMLHFCCQKTLCIRCRTKHTENMEHFLGVISRNLQVPCTPQATTEQVSARYRATKNGVKFPSPNSQSLHHKRHVPRKNCTFGKSTVFYTVCCTTAPRQGCRRPCRWTATADTQRFTALSGPSVPVVATTGAPIHHPRTAPVETRRIHAQFVLWVPEHNPCPHRRIRMSSRTPGTAMNTRAPNHEEGEQNPCPDRRICT